MELVEDQQADALQRRILLQTPGEDAFGDHFNARRGAHFTVEADAVTDGLADLFTQFAGQPFGRGTGSEASGFEHHNLLPRQPRFVEQGQRYTGGFTGAGRCFKHGFVTFSQGVAQRG